MREQYIFIFTCLVAVLCVKPTQEMRASSNPKPLVVTLEAGDGIYSLMRRYGLDAHSCNFKQFYSLNGISKSTVLQQSKRYKLPISVYTYNGQSIRTTIGIDNLDAAKAIQVYNEALETKGVKKKTFVKDKELWVPYHALHCAKPDLSIPSQVDPEPEKDVKGDRRFPIFGSKYSHTPLLSSSLRGQVFYISSGHGGPDVGAIGKYGKHSLCEDEYAYDISIRLCRKLISYGATAYMICRDPNDGIRDDAFLKMDKDEVLWGDVALAGGQKERLNLRVDVINDLYKKHQLSGAKSQKFVEIHIDSRGANQRTDVFFYYKPDSEQGKKLANTLLQTMKSKYAKYRKSGEYGGTVKSRDLHMLRETEIPLAVYVELGNIRNYGDQQRFIKPGNRQLLADWLFEGLTSFK